MMRVKFQSELIDAEDTVCNFVLRWSLAKLEEAIKSLDKQKTQIRVVIAVKNALIFDDIDIKIHSRFDKLS